MMEKENTGDTLGEGLKEDKSYLTRHGRPLSIIESTHETSSDEAESSKGSIDLKGGLHPSSEGDVQTPSTSVADDLEGQIAILFARSVGSTDELGEGDVQSIHIKDLPRLLHDLEQSTGTVILDAHMQGQVELFAKSNPDLIVQPESVVAMIKQLHAAREEEGIVGQNLVVNDAIGKASKARAESRPSSDTSSFGTSDSEEDMEESRGTVLHSPSSERKPANFFFPRSKSDRTDFSGAAEEGDNDVQSRKKTSSDPAQPFPNHRRASAPSEAQESIHRNRPRNTSGTDREVLKGRGKVKAPPSSWTRPKPQALTNRDRVRRISGSSTASGSYDGEYERMGHRSPSTTSPSSSSAKLRDDNIDEVGIAPRQRLLSQPNLANDVSTPLRQLPRSASSASQAFVFPRAASPPDMGHYDAATSERWASLVNDFRNGDGDYEGQHHRQENERSGPVSEILSPSLSSTEVATRRSVGSRKSSGAGRRRKTGEYGLDTLSSEEQVYALQAQIEGVQRLLSEKNRSIEQMQRESEDYISRLQEEVEGLKSDLSLRRKEDSLNKVRENINLDNIASLEADLNRTSNELEILRGQHSRLRNDHDDLVNAMERHTARASEYREEIAKARAQAEEAAELERQWEVDRENYRDTIKKLNDELADVQQSVLGREEDARMLASLQATIDSLTAELDEARNRGSNVLPSRVASEAGGTLSKRLGAELAKSFAQAPPHSSETDDGGEESEEEIDVDKQDEPYDRSTDSVIIIRRRKHRPMAGPSQSVDLSDRSTQTNAEKKDDTNEQGAPPAYDEVRSEKDINLRMHPRLSSSAIEGTTIGVGKAAQQYRLIARALDMRCLQMEEHLRAIPDTAMANGAQIPPLELATEWEIKTDKDGQGQSTLSRIWSIQGLLMLALGLAISALLHPNHKLGSGLASEDAKSWRTSNALQVPWSGAAQLAMHEAGQKTFWSRLLGSSDPIAGVRLPT